MVAIVPPDGGQVTVRVDAFLDERPALPRGWVPLSVVGGRALLLREVAVDVPAGLGAGERAQFLWPCVLWGKELYRPGTCQPRLESCLWAETAPVRSVRVVLASQGRFDPER